MWDGSLFLFDWIANKVEEISDRCHILNFSKQIGSGYSAPEEHWGMPAGPVDMLPGAEPCYLLHTYPYSCTSLSVWLKVCHL